LTFLLVYIRRHKQISHKKGKVTDMKHTLKISVSKEPPGGGIVGYRHVTIRERLVRFLLGDLQRLTVIVPGDSVKALSVIEEGGENGEQN
jgi:hypothetical protein